MNRDNVAMCRRCPDAVLVSTLDFRKHEFYCLECGWLAGFLEPRAEPETRVLLERIRAAKLEYVELRKGIHRCRATTALEPPEPGTPSFDADQAAIKRLLDRRTVKDAGGG